MNPHIYIGMSILHKLFPLLPSISGTLEDARLKLLSDASFIKPPYRYLFVTRNEELVSTNKEASILLHELYKKDVVKIHVLRGKGETGEVSSD